MDGEPDPFEPGGISGGVLEGKPPVAVGSPDPDDVGDGIFEGQTADAVEKLLAISGRDGQPAKVGQSLGEEREPGQALLLFVAGGDVGQGEDHGALVSQVEGGGIEIDPEPGAILLFCPDVRDGYPGGI